MTPIRLPRFAGMRYADYLAKAVPGAAWLQASRELDDDGNWELHLRAFDAQGQPVLLLPDVEERVAEKWAEILGTHTLPKPRDLSLRLFHAPGCSVLRAEREPGRDYHTGPLHIHTHTTLRGEVA